MKDASVAPQFIGENSIGHTPMGSELALATGEAFDVKVKTTVQSRERLSSSKWRTSMRYEISNAKTQPISVDLTQAGLDFALNDTRIIEESQKSQRISSDAARWTRWEKKTTKIQSL